MRVRFLLSILLFSAPLLAQTTISAQRDPQAAMIVQAALTALGGAATISQAQSWAIQAQAAGLEVATKSETFNLSPGTGTQVVLPNGKAATKPPRAYSSSLFPILIAPLLLKESKDKNYTLRYGGQTTVGSEPVAVVSFVLPRILLSTAQTWYFDTTTNLPAQIDFRLPVQIGQVKSVRGVVALSDYRSVSGILYPFSIITTTPGRPLAETIKLQSISPSTAVQTAPAGGAQ